MNDDQLKLSLKSKGWSDAEIEQTLSIMKQSGEDKKYSTLINKVMYWICLIVAVVGNLMVSIMMIPIMMAIQGFLLYLIIAVIAATFGVLFNFLIDEIESVQQEQVIMTWLFLPALAAVNVVFIVITSNDLSSTVGFLQQNPIVISIMYVVPFTLPYIIMKWRKEKRKFIIQEGNKEYIPELYRV